MNLRRFLLMSTGVLLLAGITAEGDGCDINVGLEPGYGHGHGHGHGYHCHTYYRFGNRYRDCHYHGVLNSVVASDNSEVEYATASSISVEDFAADYGLSINASEIVLEALTSAEGGRMGKLSKLGLDRKARKALKRDESLSDETLEKIASNLETEVKTVENLVSRLIELNKKR